MQPTWHNMNIIARLARALSACAQNAVPHNAPRHVRKHNIAYLLRAPLA